MKEVLVEINEYGAILHKDPSVIDKKRDLPNCFINPDLSKVYGISPTYWSLNEYNKIVKCTEEEMQRRNTFHKTIVSSQSSSIEKVNIEDLRAEFEEKFDAKEELLQLEIVKLKQEISQSKDKTEEVISKLIFELNKNKEMLRLTTSKLMMESEKNNSNHKKLAIAVLLSAILAAALKFLLL